MKPQTDDQAAEAGDMQAMCGLAAAPTGGADGLATTRAAEKALIEQEVARMTGRGRLLASRIIERIVESEAASGPDVAEAVVERLIEICRGRRRILS